MSKNETENTNLPCSMSGQTKGAPICLLLFVGFIFGFSAGYGTHDIIYKTLSKAIYGSQSVRLETAPIRKDPAVKQTTEMSDNANEVLQANEALQEEEMNPEENEEAAPEPSEPSAM